MPATLALSAVGIGGALITSNAAQKAAKIQSDASDRALDTYREQTGPYADVGRSAVNTLADLYGLSRNGAGSVAPALGPAALDAFRQSPDYQFALKEGLRGVQQSAAARGRLDSGKTLKSLTEYASNLASSNIGRYIDRLSQLAGLGANAAGATASGEAGSLLGGGEARASGVIGSANAISDSANNTIGNLTLLKLMRGGGSATGSSYATPALTSLYSRSAVPSVLY